MLIKKIAFPLMYIFLAMACAAKLPVATETFDIGASVGGRPLTVTRAGNGESLAVCVFGAIHGDEGNTGELVRLLEADYAANPALVPRDIRIYFLPVINPDGISKKQRRNANNVDLNRNFPTPNWKKDAISPNKVSPGSGGASPGSEPEIRSLTSFLLNKVKPEVREVWVLSYHARYPPSGAVQPGYILNAKPSPGSESLAREIVSRTGYKYLSTWVSSIPITGELINWCEISGMSAADIELPDYMPPDTQKPGGQKSAAGLHRGLIRGLLALGASRVSTGEK